jgi:hypothetical protein
MSASKLMNITLRVIGVVAVLWSCYWLWNTRLTPAAGILVGVGGVLIARWMYRQKVTPNPFGDASRDYIPAPNFLGSSEERWLPCRRSSLGGLRVASGAISQTARHQRDRLWDSAAPVAITLSCVRLLPGGSFLQDHVWQVARLIICQRFG